MEPSLERVAQELDLTIDDARQKLNNLPTHTQSEYQIDSLYHRKDIDALGTVLKLEVPYFAREYSQNEPNFFE